MSKTNGVPNFLPRYRQKLIEPLSDADFDDIMREGHFVRQDHKGLVVCGYYTALRISELLSLKTTQFRLSKNKKKVYIDIEIRLKKSKKTVPLPIPVNAKHMIYLLKTLEIAKRRQRATVFPYSRKTGYNIFRRAYPKGYPHYFRLNRITWLLRKFDIIEVRSWTGLSLAALEYYAGIVSVEKMGESLA